MKYIFLFFFLLSYGISIAQGGTCSSSIPLCTEVPYTYSSEVDSSAETGPNYSCLQTQMNLKWFNILIDQPGSLELTISNSNNVDIDFICWGPFTDLSTACYPSNSSIDCSYSTASTEICNFTANNSGEYYLLAVSNFANVATDISITKTNGTALSYCNGCYSYLSYSDSSTCDSTNNIYTYYGNLILTNQPTTGILTIKNCSGDSLVYNAPFLDTLPFSFSGNSDGTSCQIEAYFSDSVQCHMFSYYNKPNNCICNTQAYNFSVAQTTGYSCSSACTGTVSVTPSGGTQPYTYSWVYSPNDSTNTMDSLCTGSYSYSVSDSLNCVINGLVEVYYDSYFDSVSVSGCDTTTNNYTLTGNIITHTPPTSGQLYICLNNTDTTILYPPFSDTIPFSITGNSNGQSSNISANFSNSSNCKIYYSYSAPSTCICNTQAYNFSVTEYPGQNCNVSPCTGVVSFTASGGTQPYSYIWNGYPNDTTNTLDSLCQGFYHYQVTDSLGCNILGQIEVNKEVSFDSINVSSCDTSTNNYTITGKIISLTPPTSGLLYVLTDMGDTTIINSPFLDTIPFTITGNSNGQNINIYAYYSTDTTCKIQSQIAAPGPCKCLPIYNDFTLTVNNGLACNGACSGNCEAIANSSYPPYTYNWNDPLSQTSSIATNLCVGTYVVTVKNAIGCTLNDTAYVDSNNLTLAMLNGQTCIDTCNGSCQAIVNSNYPPYTYSWNDPNTQTTSVAYNLCIGTYIVHVSDASGCSSIDTAYVDTNQSGSDNYLFAGATIFVGDTALICVNTPNNNASIVWQTGEISQCINVTPSTSTYYSATLTFCDQIIVDSVLVTVDTTSGITKFSIRNGITVYPNPTEGKVIVNFENAIDQFDIKLLTIEGKLIKSKTLYQTNNFELNITEAPGIYFLEITDKNDQKAVIRIVKK